MIKMPTAHRGLNFDLRAVRGRKGAWCKEKYLEAVAVLGVDGFGKERKGVS